MADGTTTPFSDVDDLVMLRKHAWQDLDTFTRTATALARLARSYQDIDPLQHHGHFVITEFDLLCYDQSYLPLVVLNKAVRISGEDRLEVRASPDLSGFVRNARSTIQSMQRTLLAAHRQGGLNAFALKGLVGEVAILPAYLFQARGKMLTKPAAIHRAPELYSPQAMDALNWATRVRQDFDPLVNNPRTRLLSRIARLSCPRRHQAEALFRRYAAWVPNDHELGLGQDIQRSISTFMADSETIATGMAA